MRGSQLVDTPEEFELLEQEASGLNHEPCDDGDLGEWDWKDYLHAQPRPATNPADPSSQEDDAIPF